MFLSKKNAIYFNKPKHQDPTKPKRILGGMFDKLNQGGKTMNNKKTIKSTTKRKNKSSPKSPVKISSKDRTFSKANRLHHLLKKMTKAKPKKFIIWIGTNLTPKTTCTLLLILKLMLKKTRVINCSARRDQNQTQRSSIS